MLFMQKVSGRKLEKSIPLRLYRDQRAALDYLSISNYDAGLQFLVRTGVDILTNLARMNGNALPTLSQIKLQRQLVRRAHLDSRRKK
jgi:hypothetical protein